MWCLTQKNVWTMISIKNDKSDKKSEIFHFSGLMIIETPPKENVTA